MHPYSRPVIPLLCGYLCGIVIGSMCPGYLRYVLIAGGLLLCLLIYRYCNQKHIYAEPVLILILLGYVSIQTWIAPDFPQNHICQYKSSKMITLTGRIITTPRKDKMRTRFIIEAKKILDKKESFDVCGNVRVTVFGRYMHLDKGSVVSLRTRLKPIRNFYNPGGFDYERYMAFSKVWVSAYASYKRVTVVEQADRKRVVDIFDTFRQNIGTMIDGLPNQQSAAILKALIIGDRQGISPDLRDAFNRAGVGHLLAISGLHVGMIATLSFMLFYTGLSFIPKLLWSGHLKKYVAVLTILPVCFYGYIAGFAPSTQRAVLMICIFLMTLLFEREHDTINTICAAALILLIFNPTLLFKVSFQLSFMAVFGIVKGLTWLYGTDFFKHLESKAARMLITFLFTNICAILGTLPLVLYYFNQFSMAGMVVNCIVIPVIGFMVVPLGLLCVLVFPLSNYLSGLLLKLAAWLVMPTQSLIFWVSGKNWAAIKTVSPNFYEILLYYMLAASILLYLKASKRPKKWPVWICVILIMVDTGYWVYHRYASQSVVVTFMDVGQGNAALVEMPNGKCMLIDGGGFIDNDAFDVGKQIIAPMLWQKKILTLDHVMLTHPDRDHLNGLIYILKYFNIKRFWSNGQPSDIHSYDTLQTLLARKQIPQSDYRPGQIDLKNGVILDLLWPPADFMGHLSDDQAAALNDNSLVIKVSYGKYDIMFPGDISRKTEHELVSCCKDRLKSTILLSPHHGSKTSSSASFIDMVAPQVIVVSAGSGIYHYFPHFKTLQTYHRRGIHTFSTARHGAISIHIGKNDFTIHSAIEKPCL